METLQAFIPRSMINLSEFTDLGLLTSGLFAQQVMYTVFRELITHPTIGWYKPVPSYLCHVSEFTSRLFRDIIAKEDTLKVPC